MFGFPCTDDLVNEFNLYELWLPILVAVLPFLTNYHTSRCNYL